jgi:exodeoxyribonuclease VII small subunit
MSKPTPSTGAPAAATDAAASDDLIAAFEGSMKELEEIVTRMERGELRLEESLQLFERGMQLASACRRTLETAELRVQNLLDAHAPSPDASA